MIPANEKIDKIIEVFDVPMSPPKGVKKSALNRPRSQLHQLRSFILDRIYKGALELETHRDDKELNSD